MFAVEGVIFGPVRAQMGCGNDRARDGLRIAAADPSGFPSGVLDQSTSFLVLLVYFNPSFAPLDLTAIGAEAT